MYINIFLANFFCLIDQNEKSLIPSHIFTREESDPDVDDLEANDLDADEEEGELLTIVYLRVYLMDTRHLGMSRPTGASTNIEASGVH